MKWKHLLPLELEKKKTAKYMWLCLGLGLSGGLDYPTCELRGSQYGECHWAEQRAPLKRYKLHRAADESNWGLSKLHRVLDKEV